MYNTKEESKRDNFKILLFELAKSQVTLKEAKDKSRIYKEFESIYDYVKDEVEFRHFYSDIFAVLTQVDRDPSLGSIDILGENIHEIRVGYHPMNRDGKRLIDVSKNINKLYDHINLDIARLNNSKVIEMKSLKQQEELDETISKFNNIIKVYTETTEKLNNDIEKFEEKTRIIEGQLQTIEGKLEYNTTKAHNMQKEYITILGIFASVILAFIGNIAFSTSVLENIQKASIFRLLSITIAIAFVFINIIYLLVRFIVDINALDERKVFYLRYIKGMNITLIILLILILLAWIIDLPYIVMEIQKLYKK